MNEQTNKQHTAEQKKNQQQNGKRNNVDNNRPGGAQLKINIEINCLSSGQTYRFLG